MLLLVNDCIYVAPCSYTMKVIFLKCQILKVFFFVLECKKHKSSSHGKRKSGNIKRKICTE